jgi:hypothetical protein
MSPPIHPNVVISLNAANLVTAKTTIPMYATASTTETARRNAGATRVPKVMKHAGHIKYTSQPSMD